MKKLSNTLVLLVVMCIAQAAIAKLPTYTLAEALKKKLLTVEIQGAGGHYGKSIQLKLTNTGTVGYRLKLPAGQQFEPDDSTIQNMMVTEEMMFVLNPKKTQTELVNAMCVQKHDGGPGKTTNFSMGNMSNGHLLGIAQLLDKHKYFGDVAQNAVWCISDGEDISTIYSEDTVMAHVLQKFVSEATGQPMPKREARTMPTQPRRHAKTTVTFEWDVHAACKTTLVVLDMNNQPMMEVLKDVDLPAGHHSYTIELSTANLPEGQYKIVLYLNNQPKMSRKVKLGR